MNIETIYTELKTYMKNEEFWKIGDLLSRMEVQIRKESAYKTTAKTRVNAIKKVASKLEYRPALTGYGICGDYKIVTDSYHLVAIKQEVMPLPLVATKEDLTTLNIDLNEYREKYGNESIINAHYPDCKHFLEFNRENEVTIDKNDLVSFIKLHKKDNEKYEIGELHADANYIKNVLDVLGDCKVYIQGDCKPIYFENESGEIGLVLPVKVY